MERVFVVKTFILCGEKCYSLPLKYHNFNVTIKSGGLQTFGVLFSCYFYLFFSGHFFSIGCVESFLKFPQESLTIVTLKAIVAFTPNILQWHLKCWLTQDKFNPV